MIESSSTADGPYQISCYRIFELLYGNQGIKGRCKYLTAGMCLCAPTKDKLQKLQSAEQSVIILRCCHLIKYNIIHFFNNCYNPIEQHLS